MHIHFLGEADDGCSISSHHARALASLGAEVSFSPLDGLDTARSREADLIHLVVGDLISPRLLRDILRLRSADKRMVRVWTPEDLLWAKWHEPARAVALALARTGVKQFCRAKDEAEQLARYGLEAEQLPLLSHHVSVRSEPQPLPKQLTFLAFLPMGKRAYHGGELIDSLARWMPHIRFLVLTDEPQASDYKNMEYLTCVEDVGRSIQRTTAVIHARLDHSLSRLVVEALSHGRQVITGCDFPHTICARNTGEYIDAVRGLGREASFNLAGREYVGRVHDRRIAAEAWLKALSAVVEAPDWTGGVRGGLALAANLVCEPLVDVAELPDPEGLPPEAAAFRALLRGKESSALPAEELHS